MVVPEPFEQARVLTPFWRGCWLTSRHAGAGAPMALSYAEHADIYSNAERAADVILRERQ
jgi:hypothetical protein